MFASKVTSQVVFPDGVVNIRKLSGAALDRAAEARQMTVTRLSRVMGPELIQAFHSPEVEAAAATLAEPVSAATLELRRTARYQLYDRMTILKSGITSWTYDEKLDAVEDVDEDSAKQLHEAILDLSLPALTEQEREEAQTKG
jgi:hypothetical protein